MTEWILTTYAGKTFRLATPLAWRLSYGLGQPCDSFWVKTLWTAGEEQTLADAVQLTVFENGEILFSGVIDECECRWEENGCTAEISGRGMQALLLDNQAEAADYGQITLAEVLRNYVSPFGIKLAEEAALPAVAGFSVSSGSSCWTVLYQFARYHAGVTPRFDRKGQLCLLDWQDDAPKELNDSSPVTALLWREKRYGVLSQVVVKDVSGWNRQVESNENFQKRGGQCRRVLLTPRKTGYQARRYSARFQIERSEAERTRAEVTVAEPFFAWPGELVRLQFSARGGNGVYRVVESQVTLDENGCQTALVLGSPTAVL